MGQHDTAVMQRGTFTGPRDRCRQGRTESDPISEPAQSMESGMSHDLGSAAFHTDVQHAVTVHLASSTHLKPVKRSGLVLTHLTAKSSGS
jgi:hypothetical protein